MNTFRLRWGSRDSQLFDVTGSEGSVFQVYAHCYDPEQHPVCELYRVHPLPRTAGRVDVQSTRDDPVPHDGSDIEWFKRV